MFTRIEPQQQQQQQQQQQPELCVPVRVYKWRLPPPLLWGLCLSGLRARVTFMLRPLPPLLAGQGQPQHDDPYGVPGQLGVRPRGNLLNAVNPPRSIDSIRKSPFVCAS